MTEERVRQQPDWKNKNGPYIVWLRKIIAALLTQGTTTVQKRLCNEEALPSHKITLAPANYVRWSTKLIVCV